MMRSVFVCARWRVGAPAALLLALGASPLTAQLARVRQPSADAPKILVLPFERDRPDSALSLVVADGARERLRVAHLDRFNPITREGLCRALTESGFPCDVPLEPSVVRQLVRWLNAKFVVEGSMIRRPNDEVLVVARLSEAAGADPQAATTSVVTSLQRIGSATGSEIINRLMQGYETFDQVAECRHRLDLHDYAGAMRRARDALRDFPNNAGAHVCIARILEAQNAPADSVIAALHDAYIRDTLNTGVMRRLAQKYEAQHDTTNLLDMLRRILTIDTRDNDLRIRTMYLMVQRGLCDTAVVVVNQALRDNPASAELLNVKSIALAACAAQRRGAADSLAVGPRKDSLLRAVSALWDSAGTTLALVADIDTTKVDSMFIVRITNDFRSVPDTTRWIRWVAAATVKFPGQLDNWYTLASVRMVKGDSSGAFEAARGLLSHVPAGADSSSSPQIRGYFARGSYVVAMLFVGRGPLDSAIAYINSAVRADSTIRPQSAFVYLQAGLKSLRDSVYVVAAERLQKAHDYGTGRLLVTASLYLGLSQVQVARALDTQVAANHSCDDARRLPDLWNAAEQNVAQGAAQNRELANQLLTAVAAFKQRADAMMHNFHC